MKSKVSNHLFIGLLTVILGVVGATIPLIHAQAASTKSITVTNEKQLAAALKDNKVTRITIKTSKKASITIPTGKYAKKQLVIDAPKATITNKGNFRAISISDANEYTEKGEANKITIKDKNSLSFVEGASAKATKVTVSSNGKKLVVTDNGDLSSLKVNAKTALTVKGNSDRTPVTVSADGASLTVQKEASVKLNADVQKIVVSAKANINVAEGATLGTVLVNEAVKVSISGATKDMVAVVVNAEGAKVSATTAIDVTANANAEINLSKGAEGSKVAVADGVDTSVANKTTEKIEVTKSDGTTQTVGAGEVAKTENTSGESEIPGETVPEKQDFAVTGVELANGTSVQITMAKVEGVVFTLDGASVSNDKITYNEGSMRYELNVGSMLGGAHPLEISMDGYHTYTTNVTYAPKPIIQLTPDEPDVALSESEAADMKLAEVTVTNYLPNTASISYKYYDEDGEEVASFDEWKGYLLAGGEVVVGYSATYGNQTSDEITVMYYIGG